MTLYASVILPILSSLWTHPPAEPVGIVNTGKATCYLSSVFHCLGHVPLVANVTPDSWKLACGCSPHHHCWLCYPSVWIAGRHADNYSSKTARPVWAVERLHNLLPDASQPRLTRNRAASSSSSSDSEQVDWTKRRYFHQDPDEFLRTWTCWVQSQDRPEGCNQLLQHFFGSTLINERHCQECSIKTSVSREVMTILPQHVGPQIVCRSVEQGLDYKYSPKTSHALLEGYKCEHCGRWDTACQHSQFHSLPNVLVLSLPRTQYACFGVEKLTHHISFPEVLDLARWTHPESPDLGIGSEYDLVGVIQHHGKQALGGHCTATCRTGNPDGSLGTFSQFDDEKVTPRRLDEVLGLQASMLWYQRRQPRQTPIVTVEDTEVMLTDASPSSSSCNSPPPLSPPPADPVPASPAAPLLHGDAGSGTVPPPEVGSAQPSSSSSPGAGLARPSSSSSSPGAGLAPHSSVSSPGAGLFQPSSPSRPGVASPRPPSSSPSVAGLPQPSSSSSSPPGAAPPQPFSSPSSVLEAPPLPASPDHPVPAPLPQSPAAPIPLPHSEPESTQPSSSASPVLKAPTPPASPDRAPSAAPHPHVPAVPIFPPLSADALRQGSSSHPSPSPSVTPQPAPSPPLPSSSAFCSPHELTHDRSMPSTLSPPDRGFASATADGPSAQTEQLQHAAAAAAAGGGSLSMHAHDADTLPSTASLIPSQHPPTSPMTTDSEPTKATDNTGGSGAAHSTDLPSAANTAGASDLGVARGESAASSPPVSFSSSGVETQAVPNRSKSSGRPSTACRQNGHETGTYNKPANMPLNGGDATLNHTNQDSTSIAIRPEMAGPTCQPKRPFTRSQARLAASAQASMQGAKSAETSVSSPLQHTTALQRAGRVSKAAGKAAGQSSATAADRAAGESSATAADRAAGKATLNKRKRADEDVSQLPDQPSKRANSRQADTFSAVSTAPAASAPPAAVQKRKRADAGEDSEYMPTQPSKRNCTADDSAAACAPTVAPRRSARRTKKVNYHEMEDTEMIDVSD